MCIPKWLDSNFPSVFSASLIVMSAIFSKLLPPMKISRRNLITTLPGPLLMSARAGTCASGVRLHGRVDLRSNPLEAGREERVEVT